MATEAYRDFLIRPSPVSYMKSTDWTYSHRDYGASHVGDDRIGYAESIEACKREIDAWYRGEAREENPAEIKRILIEHYRLDNEIAAIAKSKVGKVKPDGN